MPSVDGDKDAARVSPPLDEFARAAGAGAPADGAWWRRSGRAIAALVGISASILLLVLALVHIAPATTLSAVRGGMRRAGRPPRGLCALGEPSLPSLGGDANLAHRDVEYRAM